MPAWTPGEFTEADEARLTAVITAQQATPGETTAQSVIAGITTAGDDDPGWVERTFRALALVATYWRYQSAGYAPEQAQRDAVTVLLLLTRDPTDPVLMDLLNYLATGGAHLLLTAPPGGRQLRVPGPPMA